MKQTTLFTLILLLLIMVRYPIEAQNQGWPIKGIENNGDFLDIKALTESGETMDILALKADEGDHFFDVKAIMNGSPIAVKMIISNDFYVPVKAVSSDGTLFDVKALRDDGTKLDVKGVARSGSTIKLAVIDENEKFLNVKAISPEGNTRDVFGVKFKDDNQEMEIAKVKILAHVKALPAPDVSSDQLVWNIKAIDNTGNSLSVYGIDKKGNEHDVKAIVTGGSFYVINVKGIVFRNEQPIKLFNKNNKVFLATVNDAGELIPIKAKSESGDYLEVLGLSEKGRIFDIHAVTADGAKYSIKAISEDGDIYDVKGIKVTNDDVEGEITGFVHTNLFYAHVKALPTVQ